MHRCCTEVNRWIRNTQSFCKKDSKALCSHIQWAVQLQWDGVVVTSAYSVKHKKYSGKQCLLDDIIDWESPNSSEKDLRGIGSVRHDCNYIKIKGYHKYNQLQN